MDVAHYCLDGNADSVEFCPQYPFHHILAAATYTLQEGDTPTRSGSISLFSANTEVGLKLLHYFETAGVFDMKWSPYGDDLHPQLAQVDSDGWLRLHALECGSESLDLLEARGAILKKVGGEKVSSSMCLCLDWGPFVPSTAVGISDGSVSIVSLREAQMQIVQAWEAHEFEVWATCFDTHQPQLLYTGSDDCKFRAWDLRESPSKLSFQNTKAHTMGVCSIQTSPTNSNLLLTGSYDEFLRVWDIRSTSKPVIENHVCLGGGVWRIKHHPLIPNLVLTACMHSGFAIVRFGGESIEVVEKYNKHDSLAYGADWQRGEMCLDDGKKRMPLIATCSFYDRVLRLWLPEIIEPYSSIF